MKTMKKISLWTMSLLTLLFVAGCAEQKPEQTTAETTTEAPAPVALEGEWQAIDFRDTIERTFLYTYKDAYTRLKVTEAFEDVSPTLTIEGTKVTYTYSVDMIKYFQFFAEAHKDIAKDTAEAARVLAANAQKNIKKSEDLSGTYNDETYIFKGKQEGGVLDTNAKTIVFPDVPNLFGILPLYISSKEVPITYHYEVNGDILTMYAEKVFKENGIRFVYPMKFKKVKK